MRFLVCCLFFFANQIPVYCQTSLRIDPQEVTTAFLSNGNEIKNSSPSLITNNSALCPKDFMLEHMPIKIEKNHTANLQKKSEYGLDFSDSLVKAKESTLLTLNPSVESLENNGKNAGIWNTANGQTTQEQDGTLFTQVGAIAGATSEYVPFWMRSRQHGSIPLEGASFSLMGIARKDYRRFHPGLFDWGAGLEVRANAGKRAEAILVEAYLKARLGAFQLKAGRSKDVMGLYDSVLSSGSFANAGNALGIPKVEISIPEFQHILGGELFAFKGNFALGNVGSIKGGNYLKNKDFSTYYHQKSLYLRLGKPEWKVRFYGGFNHQAFWSNGNDMYGDQYTMTPFQTLTHIVTGKTYGTQSIESSKIGNHLGSIDLGLELSFPKSILFLYRQNIYDVGALAKGANIMDGLNGISLTKVAPSGKKLDWQKMLLEVFFTKNQAGEFWSPETPSGDEDYYNNYLYREGYSYKGTGIGNPFISTRYAFRSGQVTDPQDHFVNNRVLVLHYGFIGNVQDWTVTAKVSYSHNWGTYATAFEGRTTGRWRTTPRYGTFSPVNQYFTYFEVSKPLKNDFVLGAAAAFDIGDLLYNSAGVQLKLAKTFTRGKTQRPAIAAFTKSTNPHRF